MRVFVCLCVCVRECVVVGVYEQYLYRSTQFNICQHFPPLILITEMPHTSLLLILLLLLPCIGKKSENVQPLLFALLRPGQLIYHVDYYKGFSGCKNRNELFRSPKRCRVVGRRTREKVHWIFPGYTEISITQENRPTTPPHAQVPTYTTINIVIMVVKIKIRINSTV